jgi:hypothetical protein
MKKPGRIGKALLATAMVLGSARKLEGQEPVAPQDPSVSVPSAPSSIDLPAGRHELLSLPYDVAPPPLFPVSDTDVKFRIDDLMQTLRDNKHESWALAAYPDPKTALPLIGAGFSLGIAEPRSHPQADSANPNRFLEPSSRDIWTAAGLDPAQLDQTLGVFDDQMQEWGKRGFRQKLKTGKVPPSPGFTDADADMLFRIYIKQAIYNAKAYCRDFDDFTVSQQMGVVQLVYQIGTNLEQFTNFLNTINSAHVRDPLPDKPIPPQLKPTGDHWKDVQQSLMQSQWYRKYHTRAVAVVAMLDPDYDLDNPAKAEQRVRKLALRIPRSGGTQVAQATSHRKRHHPHAVSQKDSKTPGI